MIGLASRAILLQSPLFRGVEDSAVRALLAGSRERAFAANRDLFRQGAEPAALHVIVSGRVKVWRASEQGASVTLHLFGPGAPLGCVAVFRKTPYPATATAIEPTVCGVFPRTALSQALQASQALTANALEIVGERTSLFVERLQEAATEGVETRVAAALVRVAEGYGDGEGLAMTRQDVADLAGATLHMVSRIFSRWSRQGLIQTGRGRVAVLDAAGLRSRAVAR